MGVEILFIALALTLIPLAILIATVVIVRRNLAAAGKLGYRGQRTTGFQSSTSQSGGIGYHYHQDHTHSGHTVRTTETSSHGTSRHCEPMEQAYRVSEPGSSAEVVSSSSADSPLQSFVDAAGVSFSEPSSSVSSFDSSSSYSGSDSFSASSSFDSSSSSSFSSD